jgi:hypothetical protein
MPEKKTLQRAKKDKREGKSASTQAGEFVKETIDNVREGKHGVRSTKQAIAIGLSKARRAGVKLPPPKRGKASAATIKKAESDDQAGRKGAKKKVNPKRSRATTNALKGEGSSGASKPALARQTKSAAKKRTAADRSASAKKAARTRKANAK